MSVDGIQELGDAIRDGRILWMVVHVVHGESGEDYSSVTLTSGNRDVRDGQVQATRNEEER